MKEGRIWHFLKQMLPVTQRIYECSLPTREIYVDWITKTQEGGPTRSFEGFANQIYGCAAYGQIEKRAFES
ncbi:hypothetical protein MEC_00823 [Bartonella alsatica IBS 382]|uniref:Uncharacterized protein n=1 Tax=Bartonella alsatica IBS 382 TaxID=1094551 RepID=J1IUR5_9HYPH|nr:hypothetical protein [Bartonella alsatica]EJF75347.1 hypothetical protein MEC_00823 [Bartonella alsatica IBS 382]